MSQRGARTTMKSLKQGRIAPRVTAVMLLFAAVCGCEKEPVAARQEAPAPRQEAPAPRAQDPVYTQALHRVQTQRRAIAAQRWKVVEQMEALVARARKALPPDATEEQVRAELLNNPRKYPGWLELSRMLRERNAMAEKDLEDARRLVAARIRQEQKDLSKRGGSK